MTMIIAARSALFILVLVELFKHSFSALLLHENHRESVSEKCKVQMAQMHARNDELLMAFQSMTAEYGNKTLCVDDENDFTTCVLRHQQLTFNQKYVDACKISTTYHLYQMDKPFALTDCSKRGELVDMKTESLAFIIYNATGCFPSACSGMEEDILMDNVTTNLKRAVFGRLPGLDCRVKSGYFVEWLSSVKHLSSYISAQEW